MTPLQRKVRLIEKGVTLEAIQKAIQPNPPTISHIAYVVRGERTSKRIRIVVARFLGESVVRAFGLTNTPLRRAAKPRKGGRCTMDRTGMLASKRAAPAQQSSTRDRSAQDA